MPVREDVGVELQLRLDVGEPKGLPLHSRSSPEPGELPRLRGSAFPDIDAWEKGGKRK